MRIWISVLSSRKRKGNVGSGKKHNLVSGHSGKEVFVFQAKKDMIKLGRVGRNRLVSVQAKKD